MSSQPQSLYFSCEKAGLVLENQPILWGAESVLVQALLRLPPSARKKGDFALRLPGGESIPAESIRKEEGGDKHRLFFRLHPPAASVTAELLWRQHLLGKIDLPILTEEEFVRDLRVHLPTVFVSIGGKNIAAQSFVASQSKGLNVTAMLRSPTGLAPLLDIGMKVVFRWTKSGRADEAAVPLVPAQMNAREALVSVSPPKLPRRAGEWTISWMVGDKVLAVQRVRAVSPKSFNDSLRVVDTRFLIEYAKGGLRVVRQLPPLEELRRAGPCFVLSSREAGIAGLAHIELVAHVPGATQSPAITEQTVLVTDGPTIVSPAMMERGDLEQMSAFELRDRKRSLGCLPLSPVPLAQLTGEGGFRPPTDFLWNNVAEEELLERMTRLMDPDRSNS